ncbi:mediator of RNA polymerase II transcription subunit 8 [Hydra vulgaris]|uniref:Mediator of RNA polymerase II transcription subunit 8 n=1 Tax=Hydra vulgaris TaxID=6087 RepID=T2M800_HYDVU|nr:mediator of RNA polymerase II transcription subunit 8 [Hydra vulgaris]
MQVDEKLIETSLESLVGRVGDIKVSLQNFLFKIEHEYLTWPQVLDNFALLSGQINTLNKLLKNDHMPILRNLCVLPINVQPDCDEELQRLTENRIHVFNHEVVPNVLRTKYEPDVEKEEQMLINKAVSLQQEEAEKQVFTLNELVSSILELIQSARDDWDGEFSTQQTNLAPSSNDTNILIAAMSSGAGLRKRGGESFSSKPSTARSGHRATPVN